MKHWAVGMLALTLAGCSFISTRNLDARIDADGDGHTKDVDCDDGDAAVGPGAVYRDLDGDGFGAGPVEQRCDLGDGWSAVGTDCDDFAADVHPEGIEVCNEIDDDCNGRIDDDVPEPTAWYPDTDLDNLGDPTSPPEMQCDPIPNYAPNADDCDDHDSSVGRAMALFLDADQDGFGSSRPDDAKRGCLQRELDPGGGYIHYQTNNLDCDDDDPEIHPLGAEVCDGVGVDEDCDTLIDDDDPSATGQALWFIDADQDGEGSITETKAACAQPEDEVRDIDGVDRTVSGSSPAGLRRRDPTPTAQCSSGRVGGRLRVVRPAGERAAGVRGMSDATSTRTTRPWGGGTPSSTRSRGSPLPRRRHRCGPRLRGGPVRRVTCWGDDDTLEVLAEAEGPFTSVEIESSHTAGARRWAGHLLGDGISYTVSPTGGVGFMQAAAGPSHACTVEQMTEASGDYNGMTVGQALCFGAAASRGSATSRPSAWRRSPPAGSSRAGCWPQATRRPRRWVRALLGGRPEDAYCPDAGAAQVVAAGGNICIRGVDGRVQCGDSLTAFGAEGSVGAWTAYRDIAVGPFVACGVTVDGELDCESLGVRPY